MENMTEPPSGDSPEDRGSRPPRRQPGADPKTAGFLLVASIIALGGAGLGLGALLGAPVPLALVGLFAGLVVGFLVVHSRFKDI